MVGERRFPSVTSAGLHLLAMACMFCDHLQYTLLPRQIWLNCVGRIAFPIFAFMIVEGYFHTHNLRKYVGRLAVLAVLSEIPFNLMLNGSVLYPIHQNVIWTFLISILMIWLNEKARDTGNLGVRVIAAGGTLLLGFLMGIFTFADYDFAGVFMVLCFYFFRGNSPHCLLAQFLTMVTINVGILGGRELIFALGGLSLRFPIQGFAVLALLPIWLYRGEQGMHGKGLQYLNYGFYPAHMLLLSFLKMFI